MLSWLRIIKFSLQDIGRNFGLSLMTIFVIILTLLSVNTFLIIRIVTTEATEAIKQQIDVSIYFEPGADAEDVTEAVNFVRSFSEVTETIFLTPEEALDVFKEQHQDDQEVLLSLEELDENPLGATLILKTKEPSDFKTVLDGLAVPEYEEIIESKTFTDSENAIEKIDAITTQVEQFSLVLIIIFSVITFLIIFNTLRVAIYTQRAEISIKKLVGATNWFVRGPYVFMCLVFSLVSVVTSAIIVFFMVQMIDPYITILLGTENVLTNYFNSNIISLFSLQFGAVFLLTLISAMMAMRRYLRV